MAVPLPFDLAKRGVPSRGRHRRDTVATRGSVPVTVEGTVAGKGDAGSVRRAARGCRASFGDLYRTYARTVHGILLAHVRPHEVDDLVQEVFLAAWRKLSRLRDPESFGAWLAAIARNRARDFHRRHAATGGVRPLSEALVEAEAPPDRAEAVDDADEVLARIRELPEAYREPLVLRLVEGMNGPEIAERTGLTAGSVRVNLHRGMKLLRERLAREGER